MFSLCPCESLGETVQGVLVLGNQLCGWVSVISRTFAFTLDSPVTLGLGPGVSRVQDLIEIYWPWMGLGV